MYRVPAQSFERASPCLFWWLNPRVPAALCRSKTVDRSQTPSWTSETVPPLIPWPFHPHPPDMTDISGRPHSPDISLSTTNLFQATDEVARASGCTRDTSRVSKTGHRFQRHVDGFLSLLELFDEVCVVRSNDISTV